LLIEPSGAGHAADIVDTLAIYESQKALELDSVVCLVDSQDAARILTKRPANEWSQIQSADALLLSKPDLAHPAQRQAFEEIAAAHSIRSSPISALAATANCPKKRCANFSAHRAFR
jgi:G3E family GTPase